MGFLAVSRPKALELIKTFSSSDRIGVFVGSGVSTESGLPTWREFILGLLARAFDGTFAAGPDERRQWAQQILDGQQVTGAAAVVRALAPDEKTFAAWLVAELYGGADSSMFQPRPIATAVAELRRQLGGAMVIATTNYDDLLEKALRAAGFAARDVRPYIQRRAHTAPGAVPVMHLHGYAGAGDHKGKLVLSEEEYTRMQRGAPSWQEQFVTDLLRERPCLFVGTSLVDPNVIRYLYGYGGRSARHWAVFARQSDEPRGGPVAEAREKAMAARWARCGVRTLFLDHYSDVAQLLHEVRVAHAAALEGGAYTAAAVRAARWIAEFEASVAGVGDAVVFTAGQEALSALLQRQLTNAIDLAVGTGASLGSERLGISLWIAEAGGEHLVDWASSHEVHLDAGLVRRVAIEPESSWAAAQAFCRGTPVQLDLPSGSPWGSALALPLRVSPKRPGAGPLPVGAIQLNSSARFSDTCLTSPVRGSRVGLGDWLLEVVAKGVAEGLMLLNPEPGGSSSGQQGGIL